MNLKLKLLSSLAKVFLDAEPASDTFEAPLTMFQNEVASFQAAWRNLDAEYRANIKLEVRSPIIDLVRVRRVGHVPVKFATFPDADENYLRKSPGLYPDLLSEPEVFFRAWADKWESAWIDIEPRADTPAGIYPIEIAITDESGNPLASAAKTIEIFAAELPQQKLIHTKWFHCDGLCQYYGVDMFSGAFFEICENFIRAAVKRGINMILMPTHTPPLDTAVGHERMTCQLVDISLSGGSYIFGFDNLRRWVDMCRRCGVRYYEIAHLFSQWGAKHAPKIVATVDGEPRCIFGWETDATGEEYRAFLHAYLPALTRELRALGIDKQCYFHISDEPSLAMLDNYRAAKAVVADLLDGYPIMDALSNFDFYSTGALTKPIPANNHIQPFLDANVEGLWTYYCVGQYKDVSNSFISMPSLRTRILGVQLYKFRIDGFLQWGYNFYNCQGSWYPVNPYLVTDGDGFTPAGDCFQVYPGAGGVPEESIRMMVADEAMADMRAFELLESLKGRDFVMGLIEDDLSEPITFDRYPTSDAYMLNLREKVNRAIAQAL